MDLNKTGKYLKKLREENNLTQSDIASKLGVSVQAVSKWETGKSFPDVGLLERISELYNVKVEYLLNGKLTETIGYYNKKTKMKSIFIITLVIVFSIFTLFFLTAFNKFKIYELNSGDVAKGYFVSTTDYNVFDLKLSNTENIDRVMLYYKVGEQGYLIIKGGLSVLNIMGEYKYGNEIDMIKNHLNDLYVRIYYNDSYEDIKINTELIHVNNSLINIKHQSDYSNYKDHEIIINNIDDMKKDLVSKGFVLKDGLYVKERVDGEVIVDIDKDSIEFKSDNCYASTLFNQDLIKLVVNGKEYLHKPLDSMAEYEDCLLLVDFEFSSLKNDYLEVYIRDSQFYNVKNQLDWKAGKMPKTRGIDLFGIRISDGIQPVANSKSGTVVYSMYNECLGTTEQKSINLASNGSWKFDNSGYGVAFQLPKNTTYSFYYDRYFINTWDCTTSSPKIAESSGNKSFPVTLKSLSSTMSFDVTKTYANAVMNAISAYGTYQHSVKSLTLNEALSFSIGSSGLGGVFVVSASIKNKYDNMGGTHAQLIGINW